MLPRNLPSTLALAALVGCAPVAAADLTVTAVIQGRAHVVPVAQGPLTITAEDVRRGYLDASAALPLQVQQGPARSLNLWVRVRSAAVERLQVTASSSSVELDAGGGLLPLLAGRGGALPPLRIRIFLRPGVAPGAYPWPLQVGALF
jgi:hypothetical protein